MKYEKFDLKDFDQLVQLQIDYKQVIGEKKPSQEEIKKLKAAIENEQITFYVAIDEEKLIAMCSTSLTFSTFNYSKSGVFEDFFVAPSYRKKGIARELTQFVLAKCKKEKVESLWVGCADIDEEMYKKLGFDIPLGNLLAWNA